MTSANRTDLLRSLEMCSVGTNTRENLEQSSCFVFSDGFITTFNGEIFCKVSSPINIEGAVPAKPLLELLRKLTEEELEITATSTELRVKGKGRRSAIRLSDEIILDTSDVDSPDKDWTELPPAFSDVLPVVANCAAKESDPFAFCCVHLTPKGMEATDRSQAIRYRMTTGLSENVLIRGSSCRSIATLGIASVNNTASWLHWKTYSGMVISVRKIAEAYPKGLTAIFQSEKIAEMDIPGSVADVIGRSAPFIEETSSGKRVEISVNVNTLYIRAQNGNGWYEEEREIVYDSVPCRIAVNPTYFLSVLRHASPIDICQGGLRIVGDSFVYCVSAEQIPEPEPQQV